MKGKYLAVALGILIILVSLVSACGGSKSTATQTATATNTATAITTHTATATSTSTATATTTHTATATATATQTATATPTGNTLSSILGLGANITSVYYEMNVTGPGGDSVIKVWEKDKKFREEMEGFIIIMDTVAGVTYTNISGNTWMKTTTTAAPEGASEDPSSILQYNPEITGTETIDGKSCTVFEWTTDTGTLTEWIWTEKGFPIKIVSTSSAGTSTILFTNISFDDIPDSMFELPVDAEVTEYGT